MRTTDVAIEIPQTLGATNRIAFRTTVLRQLEATVYERAVFDASHCHTIDWLGVATLLTLQRLIETSGREFALVAADSTPVRDTVKARGLHHVMNVRDTAD